MALDEYGRYQLQWMMGHGFSLHDLVGELASAQSDLEEATGANVSVREAFAAWERDRGFSGELWACREEFAEESAAVKLPSRTSVKLSGDFAVASIQDGPVHDGAVKAFPVTFSSETSVLMYVLAETQEEALETAKDLANKSYGAQQDIATMLDDNADFFYPEISPGGGDAIELSQIEWLDRIDFVPGTSFKEAIESGDLRVEDFVGMLKPRDVRDLARDLDGKLGFESMEDVGLRDGRSLKAIVAKQASDGFVDIQLAELLNEGAPDGLYHIDEGTGEVSRIESYAALLDCYGVDAWGLGLGPEPSRQARLATPSSQAALARSAAESTVAVNARQKGARL